MRKFLLAAIGLLLIADSCLGGFKHCPRSIDRWYRTETDWGMLKDVPDKYQHLSFSYYAQWLADRRLPLLVSFPLVAIAGWLKELDDQEGISNRDVLSNLTGQLGACFYGTRVGLIPYFNSQQKFYQVRLEIAF